MKIRSACWLAFAMISLPLLAHARQFDPAIAAQKTALAKLDWMNGVAPPDRVSLVDR